MNDKNPPDEQNRVDEARDSPSGINSPPTPYEKKTYNFQQQVENKNLKSGYKGSETIEKNDSSKAVFDNKDQHNFQQDHAPDKSEKQLSASNADQHKGHLKRNYDPPANNSVADKNEQHTFEKDSNQSTDKFNAKDRNQHTENFKSATEKNETPYKVKNSIKDPDGPDKSLTRSYNSHSKG